MDAIKIHKVGYKQFHKHNTTFCNMQFYRGLQMKTKLLGSWGSLTCLQKVKKEETVPRIDKLQRAKEASEKKS